jgi:hypothetical protein
MIQLLLPLDDPNTPVVTVVQRYGTFYADNSQPNFGDPDHE